MSQFEEQNKMLALLLVFGNRKIAAGPTFVNAKSENKSVSPEKAEPWYLFPLKYTKLF